MVCKHCLKELASSLSGEAKKMLYIVSKSDEGLTRSDIQKKWLIKYDKEINYSTFIKIRDELENKLFIDDRKISQTKLYELSENGKRLVSLTSKNKK